MLYCRTDGSCPLPEKYRAHSRVNDVSVENGGGWTRLGDIP